MASFPLPILHVFCPFLALLQELFLPHVIYFSIYLAWMLVMLYSQGRVLDRGWYKYNAVRSPIQNWQDLQDVPLQPLLSLQAVSWGKEIGIMKKIPFLYVYQPRPISLTHKPTTAMFYKRLFHNLFHNKKSLSVWPQEAYRPRRSKPWSCPGGGVSPGQW